MVVGIAFKAVSERVIIFSAKRKEASDVWWSRRVITMDPSLSRRHSVYFCSFVQPKSLHTTTSIVPSHHM